MELSEKVARRVNEGSAGNTTKRKSRNSPFGGMNQTEFSGQSSFVNQPSRSQLQRGSRLQKGSKEKPKEPRNNDDTFHALKMQQALAKVSYSHRNTVKDRIREVDSFAAFPLLPAVSEAITSQVLAGLEEVVPTPIQRLAIPALLRDPRIRHQEGESNGFESFLLAAETGSGKTLAYTIPVVDAVKRGEAVETKAQFEKDERERNKSIEDPYYITPPAREESQGATTARPRAIILLPSAELVEQITSVLKSLSHKVKFRAAGISGHLSPTIIHNRLFSPNGIDILVTTPQLLESITTSDPNVLSRVKHLVVDEADSLFDRSFAASTSTIIDKSAPSLKQLIMCSATIPRSMDTYLRSRFPRMQRLTTPNLHAVPRRVQLGVVDVAKDPYRDDKDLACAHTIQTISKAASEGDRPGESAIKHILVFVNEREKTQEVAKYLQKKGFDATALNRDIAGKARGDVLAGFTSDTKKVIGSVTGDNETQALTVRPGGLANVKVLVTTDLGSRGIDTVSVRHVILYDVPHSTVDFIHRLGRTGRMGRRGRGIVLVGKGDRRDVVREVREGMFRGQALI